MKKILYNGYKYSQTCIERSPLGQRKSKLIRGLIMLIERKKCLKITTGLSESVNQRIDNSVA
jgi:hypothetical protein